ncbi:MAG: Gfo/Idh/MocA family oxidoreductase [Planctomycetes bacterium]|nr:Gfo/Idh/MocA family oxidoreductase [Planctomycetota bacterium]
MVRIGVIGCGYWGINYIRACHELEQTKVVRVCDINDARLRIIHKRFPYVFPTSRVEDLINDPEIDAIIIATEAESHYTITKTALANGKHTLVEKPLSTNIEHAKELILLAEKSRRTLMVGHTFLYNASINKIKEYITQDSFGAIYYLHATRTHLGLIRNDVNAIWDLAPHDIAVFSYFLGTNPLWVSAVGGCFLKDTKPDVGFISLGYPNNVIGNIHVSWVNSNKVREIVVVGSKKRVVFDDLNNLESVRIYEKGAEISGDVNNYGEFQLQLRDGDIISPRIETSEPLKNQIKHFVSCLEKNTIPLSDGQSGLMVVKVLAAIERSLQKRGVPEEIPQ